MNRRDVKTAYRISEVVDLLGISADTLRYYEKIGLLKAVHRTTSGIRRYLQKDISRLRFIKRAKTMKFSLDEISRLLTMREDPQHARQEVRELTLAKLKVIDSHLGDLTILKNELTLLVSLCQASEDGCPIFDDIQDSDTR